MTIDHEADILILGAGPAGCAAAIIARLAGLKVINIETRMLPKKQPGETLHPGIEAILKQLGVFEQLVAQNYHRHRGVWQEKTNHQRVFQPYGNDENGPWLGFQVNRNGFNEILRSRVRGLGGSIIRVTRVERRKLDSGLQGICTDHGTFKAQVVMDATGRRAWLAGELQLIPERIGPAQRLRFGWTRHTRPELEGQPLFLQCSNGWEWVSPLGNGHCAWVELHQESESRGLDYTWRIFRQCAGPGYFLLGDAAYLIDPSVSNGVLRAMMSGIYAVRLITAANYGASHLLRAATEYKRWIGESFDMAVTNLNSLSKSG